MQKLTRARLEERRREKREERVARKRSRLELEMLPEVRRVRERHDQLALRFVLLPREKACRPTRQFKKPFALRFHVHTAD